MNSVIVGIFESPAAANEAKNKLLVAGFSNETVVVSDEDIATMNTATIAGSAPVQHEKKGAISRFFHSIFGGDDDESTDQYGNTYREAIRRGHYGVSVSVNGEAEMDRAEKILTDCGAFDIDGRSEQWRGEGWVAGGDLANTTALSAAAVGMAGDNAGMLKERSEELKVGKRSVARGDVRVFSRMEETPVEETVRDTVQETQVEVEKFEPQTAPNGVPPLPSDPPQPR